MPCIYTMHHGCKICILNRGILFLSATVDKREVTGPKPQVFKETRPSFFFLGGGYHPTLKLSGIPTFTFIVSLTHRMDNI